MGWAVVSYPVFFDIKDGYMDAETFYAEMLYTVLVVSNALIIGRLINDPIICGGVISMAITAGDWAIGKISGGCFNPAIGLGVNVVNYAVNGNHFEHTWIYVLSPLFGGVVAGLVSIVFAQEIEKNKIK